MNIIVKQKQKDDDTLTMQDNFILEEEVNDIAKQLFGGNVEKRIGFVDRLRETYRKAQGNDFLLIHNPGGWGGTRLEQLLKWERSVVEGIRGTIEHLGYSYLLTQYFRGGRSWWAHARDIIKEARFFLTGESTQAAIAAAEFKFIAEHSNNLKVLLIGASQGAAFSNAVMRHLNGVNQVYSIEMGTFFPHVPRRVITDRTLALDNNGLMPDPMCHRNLLAGFEAYITAPFRWVKYRRQGNPQKFTYCINAPGHDYSWEYPEVRGKITDFLTTNFGNAKKPKGGSS